MATAVTSNKMFSNASMRLYDHDPGTTAATVVSGDGGTTKNYLDMRDYNEFCVVAMSSALTGAGITLVEILAADDTAGTNATVVVAGSTVAADAVGDNAVLSCTVDQMKEVLSTARYATGRLTCANSADEAVVLMGRFGPRYPQSGLTANYIS